MNIIVIGNTVYESFEIVDSYTLAKRFIVRESVFLGTCAQYVKCVWAFVKESERDSKLAELATR